ncbi:hypothetical protein HHI36_011434 [Cryptolaemus montrouzieri]|uniref:Uncharacterized protein n=1 Tax=Cryptolaemus montrouzieri TaxID=559131 RepID=A0ABD2MLN8_9CUCU
MMHHPMFFRDIGGPGLSNVTSVDSKVDQELSPMANRIVGSLREKTWENDRFYFVDVFACNDRGRAREVSSELVRRAELYPGEFILVSLHDDHVHVVHDCPYSNRSCRCAFKKFQEAEEDVRRLLRRPRRVQTLQNRDWKNSVKYYSTQGRAIAYCRIGRANKGLCFEDASVSHVGVPEYDELETQRCLEDGYDPSTTTVFRERRGLSEGVGDIVPRKRRHIEVPFGRLGVTGQSDL